MPSESRTAHETAGNPLWLRVIGIVVLLAVVFAVVVIVVSGGHTPPPH